MKTINEMEKDYEEYEPKTEYVNSKEELFAYLDVLIDDADESIDDLEKEKKANNKQLREAKLRNLFPFIFMEEDIEFYIEDNDIVESGIILNEEYKNYINKMKEIVTDENIKTILKLAEFSILFYNNQIDYIDMQRDKLEYYYKGINYCNSKYQDESKTFDEFFKRKISEIPFKKPVEKIKNV